MRAGKVSRRRGRLLATAVAALFVALLASMTPASASVPVPISGAGSTWSYNAFHDWITDVAQFGLTVNYAPVGSTAGRTDFRNGTVDFAASDIPYGVPDGSISDPPPTRGYATWASAVSWRSPRPRGRSATSSTPPRCRPLCP